MLKKFIDYIFEQEAQPTFAALYPSEVTAYRMYQWALSRGIENPVPTDKMHVTTMFSRRPVKYTPKGMFESSILIDPETYRIERLGSPKSALVLKFDSPQVREFWQAGIDKGASWDYNEFIPHMTLTYDGDDYTDSQITAMGLPPTSLRLIREDTKPLDIS